MPRDRDEWLAFAREDVRMAKLALREEIYNQVCFHAQQAVEKLLKSSIAGAGNVVPRTHKTADLVTLVTDLDLSHLRHDLLRLDRFYIPTRYPDALPGMLTEGMPNRRETPESYS